ncbi:DNA primase [Agarivorans sp. B2Z047]|uniref:DNA primase n=1 Tax=Agarivorans sp. B2Z047 TaxID=2652721 RepID=UPI00128C0AEF|nr:DNA primase [Agarivorans sp. B2Z047]MPW30580.1 DNA primase [Agarivorans sp. B2Z047]UQN42196.1 DNA primase [Agarivorans sp. B2Z047]
MAGRIPQQFIDDLLARTDIVSLIDQRVRLKKAGKNYSACCPFHNEKSPSFTVSQDKQFYHCFGCGAHGNAISFLMEYDKLEFVDAIEDLASQMGVEVERENSNNSKFDKEKSQQQRQASKDLYELIGHASRFFQQQLRTNPNKQQVIDYLKSRGLSGEVVQRFSIGYAPDEWDALGKALGGSKQASQQLVDAGLSIENDKGRRYDRFRDRVMFPIRDKRGRYIGFGGRVFGDGTPKYLNSPETSVFHKGRELYGLYEVRQAHKQIPQILVVEGYMDVVSLAQFEIDYAVASLGTSTTPEHLQTLFRTSNQIICCYDGDRAGRDAAWRALENALPHLRDNVELKFMFLPDGEDPDTLVRQEGKDGFEQRMHKAMPLSRFMFERLSQEIDVTTDAGKSHLAARASELIKPVQAEFYREMLKGELAKWLRWDSNRLTKFFAASDPKPQNKQANSLKITPMRKAIAMILQRPDIANELPPSEQLKQVNIKGMPLLLALIGEIHKKPEITTGQLIERWREQPEQKHLSALAGYNLEIDESGYPDELQDIIASFVEQLLLQRYEQLNVKSLQGTLSVEEKYEMQQLVVELKP